MITAEQIKDIQLHYKKVDSHGGTYVVETFFNPETKDTYQVCTRDYEYSDGSRDIDELYNMPYDDEARKLYLRHIGFISEGDEVVVVKGRKLPKGAVKTVKERRPYKDRYGRWLADYLYFTDGTKTNADNCELKEI